jgi:hypothetical protein
VTVPSLAGAAAGVLLLVSLAGFLTELDGEGLRLGGLGLSLVFEALGVVLLVVNRGRRSHTAGVALAALGVVPLVFFTFFDLRSGSTLVGGDDYTLTASIALLVTAVLWFAGHRFGPSSSHVLFLGGALVAIWLAVTIQAVDEGLQPTEDRYGRSVRLLPTSATEEVRFPDMSLRNRIEGERYMAGEVTCDAGELVSGDAGYWSCEGPWPYPDHLFDSNEFLALQEEYGVSEDDLDRYGPYDSVEVGLRLQEFRRYDRGEVECVDGEPTGSSNVWVCDGDDLELRPLNSAWSAFEVPGSSEGFDPLAPGSIETDPFGSDDPFGFESDPFDEYPFEDDPFSEGGFGESPYLPEPLIRVQPLGGSGERFGWSTLFFGLAYLGGGALLDRRGDHRRATAFFAVASPLAYVGIAASGLDEVWAYGLAFLVVGVIAAKLGADQDRRFTAWSGTLAATAGTVYVVFDVLGGNPSGTAVGLSLLVVGLAAAVGAHLLDQRYARPASGTPTPGAPVAAVRGPSRASASPPTGPPLAPPPASQGGGAWAAPTPAQPTAPPQTPGEHGAPVPQGPPSPWAAPSSDPAAGAGPGVPPPAFDPRPPGSSDPLPPSPEGPSGRPDQV